MNKKEWKAVMALFGSLTEKHKDVLAAMVLTGVFEAVRPFIAIVLTGMLVDAAYAGASLRTLLSYALIGVTGTLLMYLIKNIGLMFFNRKLEYMQEIQNLPLNKKSMVMDYEYLEDPQIHEKRQRIERFGGGWSLTSLVLSAFNKLITNFVMVIVAIAVVIPSFVKGSHSVSEGFVGSWLMSCLFLAVVLAFLWAGFKLGGYFNRKVAQLRGQVSGYEARSKYYLDILSGYEKQKDLRLCKQQALYEREYESIASGMKKIIHKMSYTEVADIAAQQTVSSATSFLVYVFVGVLACLGLVTIGSVVTAAAAILKFTDGAARFIYVLTYFKRYAGFAQDYVEYMNLSQRKHEGTIPIEKRRDGRFSVEFENVSFRYPGSKTDVLKNLNLKFEIGEKMAIVGKNGSGKTTFIKLLCRLYDVTEGCIKVNGIDIRKYDYEEYCNLFAVVFQDFQVFSFGLGENVAAGLDVDEALAVEALAKAGMEERFKSLPMGLLTSIGKEFEESGVTFSGGEKQKIAIARAIYKNAPFVIMDEPTAALDPESECEVYAGFDEMVGNKTAIYISHRLASCRFCQDILVFDAGKIVQRGSHEQLEHQEGLYKELWEAQAQYYA